jgi:hypothetical protein
VVVRGLDRVLEMKQRAVQMRREAEAHAAKVFRLNPKAPAHPYTVPKPFSLAGVALAEARRAKKAAAAATMQ